MTEPATLHESEQADDQELFLINAGRILAVHDEEDERMTVEVPVINIGTMEDEEELMDEARGATASTQEPHVVVDAPTEE